MIEVVNVWKSYRSGDPLGRSLAGNQLPDRTGRFAFIVGPSGSGKSTLLYLLGALDRPTERRDPGRTGRAWSPMSEAHAKRLSPRPGRLHLPVVQPDQQPDGPGERAGAVLAPRDDGRAAAAGGRACSRRSAWATGSTISPTSSPAASSSAWPSPGP